MGVFDLTRTNYSWITNTCLILGIASAFGFDGNSHPGWLFLGGISASVAITTYFVRHLRKTAPVTVRSLPDRRRDRLRVTYITPIADIAGTLSAKTHPTVSILNKSLLRHVGGLPPEYPRRLQRRELAKWDLEEELVAAVVARVLLQLREGEHPTAAVETERALRKMITEEPGPAWSGSKETIH